MNNLYARTIFKNLTKKLKKYTYVLCNHKKFTPPIHQCHFSSLFFINRDSRILLTDSESAWKTKQVTWVKSCKISIIKELCQGEQCVFRWFNPYHPYRRFGLVPPRFHLGWFSPYRRFGGFLFRTKPNLLCVLCVLNQQGPNCSPLYRKPRIVLNQLFPPKPRLDQSEASKSLEMLAAATLVQFLLNSCGVCTWS